MRKVLFLFVVLSSLTITLSASNHRNFVGIEAIETSSIMCGKAEIAPIDEALFESVASHLRDYTDYLIAQGADGVSVAKINQWLLMNKKYFTNDKLATLGETLKSLDAENFNNLVYMDYKDPTVSLILSILVGGLGVDRFVIGDVGLGIGKLLTAGGLGVWWLVDIFCIEKATKNKNWEAINEFFASLQ